MKVKFLLFAMLITVSLVSSVYGHAEPEMAVVVARGSEVFKVIYKGGTSGKVKLNVFDSQGRVIHSASLAGQDGFICPLNFKGLPSGSYTIELIDDYGSYQREVDHLAVLERKSIRVGRLNEEGKFLFTVANAQNEPIVISIYDQDKRLVYSVTKTLKGDFAQVFRMLDDKNHYTFAISDAGGNEKVFAF